MKRSLTVVVLLGTAAATGCGDDGAPAGDDVQEPDAQTGTPLTCEVAVVGGGAGGLHTAFRLAPELGEGVCLFEKEAVLGGRIHDIPMDETDPQSPKFGTGARRVMEGQTVLEDLAVELGLTLELAPGTTDLINARNLFSFSKEDFVPRYPGLTPIGGDTETALYEAMIADPDFSAASSFPDFRGFLRETYGGPATEFLHDMSRFRADFEYSLDARGYLDYLLEEWDVCCDASYPVGGMSAFIDGMADAATADGARIFTSDPVASISRNGTGYRLVTADHVVTAEKVVIAVPPVALEWITGDVVDDIKAQTEYQDIIGVKVVTITQWWPTAWWSNIVDPGGTAPDNQVWRAWTTENCINFIEIPLDPYSVAQNVTRTVYDDDASCVELWEDLASDGDAAVEAEIKRMLEHIFDGNGVTTPASVTIPDPVKTHVQIWPAAWHWLRAGAEHTNAQVFAWAADPLDGEEVGLVGEAYNVNRSGWSDGAYKSSINLLNTRYGMSLRIRPAPRVDGPRKIRAH